MGIGEEFETWRYAFDYIVFFFFVLELVKGSEEGSGEKGRSEWGGV